MCLFTVYTQYILTLVCTCVMNLIAEFICVVYVQMHACARVCTHTSMNESVYGSVNTFQNVSVRLHVCISTDVCRVRMHVY